MSAGADPPSPSSAVSGFARVELVGPTTGPHASKSLTAHPFERTVAALASFRSESLAAVHSHHRAIRRPLSGTRADLRAAPLPSLPQRSHGPAADPFRPSADTALRALSRVESLAAVSTRRRAVRRPPSDEKLQPASCFLRIAPAKELCSGGETRLGPRRRSLRALSRVGSSACRPLSPSSGPKTTV
jgi:hypothetical protein